VIQHLIKAACRFSKNLLFVLLFISIPIVSMADTNVGGRISADTTWTLDSSPYIVTSNLYIYGTSGDDGVTTLTIEAGVEIRFNGDYIFSICSGYASPGALIAQGTTDDPIVFTSNQATPAAGDWNRIEFMNYTSDSMTIMENCIVEYGGSSGLGSVYIYYSSPTIRDCIVRNSGTQGGYVNSGGPTIDGSTFVDNTGNDIYWAGTTRGNITGNAIEDSVYFSAAQASPSLDGTNVFDNAESGSYIGVGGGRISTDGTWCNAAPYRIDGTVYVYGTSGSDSVTALTIEPGAEIRFNGDYIFSVCSNYASPGALIAQGTTDDPIVFTSNQATPAAGDWNRIEFMNYTSDSMTIMENCIVEYGGSSTYGSVYMYYSSPTFMDCIVRDSSKYGIYLDHSNLTIDGCTFTGNAAYDVYYLSGDGDLIFNTFTGGIYLASGNHNIVGNIFTGDSEYDLYYASGSGTVEDNMFIIGIYIYNDQQIYTDGNMLGYSVDDQCDDSISDGQVTEGKVFVNYGGKVLFK
jgi:hypothetical protein